MSLPPTKALVAEAEAGAGGLFKLWIRVMRILETQDKHAKLIEAQTKEIATLRDPVLTLQAREDGLIARAELAAQKVAGQAMADMARRVGHLESRAGHSLEARPAELASPPSRTREALGFTQATVLGTAVGSRQGLLVAVADCARPCNRKPAYI